MKNIFRLLAPLALALSGCVYEELPNNELVQSEGRIFTASLEQDETRTYVEEGNLLRWNAGDQIALFDGNTLNRQYKFDGETGDNSGTFSIVSSPYGTGNDLTTNYAVYPYASNLKITEAGILTVTLPSEQTYTENSFGLGANTMVAVTKDIDDTFLKFKNACGYLRLQLYGYDVTVKSIALTGNSNEKIAGKSSIIPTYNDEPHISMSDGATSSITLSCGKGVKIGSTAENATDFWIVIPPTTFEGGFTITITDINDETFTKSTSNEIAIERNVIKPMKTFEVIFENETEDEGSSNDYIDEYGINHGKGVEISGVVWAPVNCGYHKTDFKYGKLYQWGRKYGQGYDNADVTFPEIVEGPVSLSIGQSKDNEDKFFYSPDPGDWCEIKNDYLWNSATESNPVKTEYDPCPDGWRVPTYTELNALYQNRSTWICEDGQTGYRFSGKSLYSDIVSQVFLESAGYRYNYTGGEAKRRGENGAYWSSRKGDDHGDGLSWARLLSFSSDHVYMADGSRANAYSVRCVRE